MPDEFFFRITGLSIYIWEKAARSKWKKSRLAPPERGITIAYKVCSKMSLMEGSEEDEC
jgi:hypothetical protein